jgi:Ca-activated chloride channel family protein
MQFGAAVALFGMLLRGSPYAGVASFDTVLDLASAPRTAAAEAQRGEFLDLVRRAKAVQATARQQ